MAYEYPNAPSVGQVANGYVWDGEKWVAGTSVGPVLATKKNYIINGAMQISQENGSTAGVTANYYPVDMFVMGGSNAGVQTVQQVASPTPAGSPNRFRLTCSTADATVGAGDYGYILTAIEGLRAVDLKSGTASAKTVTLQFGVKAPAGTYCVAFKNAAQNRSYIAEYVITSGEANTDVVKSVTLTLDSTGTWATDNTVGMYIYFTYMVGSSSIGPANAWQTVGIGTTNQFNFMGTVNNVFELFDVSLTEGSVAPPFQVPDYASELQLCRRYFQIPEGNTYSGFVISTSAVRVGAVLSLPMRVGPTIVPVNGTLLAINTISSNTYATSLASSLTVFGPQGGTMDIITASTTLTAGHTCSAYFGAGCMRYNARL